MSCIVCTFCFQIEYVSRSTFLIDQALKSFRETALSLSCIERNIQLPPQIEFYASLCANDSILFCQDINTVEGLNRAAEADLMIRRAHGDRSRETMNRVVERRQDAMTNEEERDVSFKAAHSSLTADGGRATLGVAKKPDESNTQWMMLESLSLVLFQPRATQTKSNLITVLHYHECFGTLSASRPS